MNNFSKKLGTWIFSLFLTSQAYAQSCTVTSAMLEQFKQLPREQQVQLAAQYGIDLSQILMDSTPKALQLQPPLNS
ncbi:MAG: hypothetical protein U5L01_00005 [Rheinheimera sp.]|nr:hypothetical protein [Rheinheimera sp.]